MSIESLHERLRNLVANKKYDEAIALLRSPAPTVNRLWVSDICSYGSLGAFIEDFENQGWTFHSFSVSGGDCVALFYMEKI